MQYNKKFLYTYHVRITDREDTNWTVKNQTSDRAAKYQTVKDSVLFWIFWVVQLQKAIDFEFSSIYPKTNA